MNGTLLVVVEAADLRAVERFVADDPYSRHDLFATIEIWAWDWSLGRSQNV